MIDGLELHRWSVELLVVRSTSEVCIRRAISGLYYGLFHRIAFAGADSFEPFGQDFQQMVKRGYDHGRMSKLCRRYTEWAKSPAKNPIDWFGQDAPDERLVLLARSFTALQEARHEADYNLGKSYEQAYALELLELAEAGHWKLDELQGSSVLTTFVGALLLEDRLPRRG